MVALYTFVVNVRNGYFNLKDAIVEYALAVARDTQTNGLTI